MGEFAHRLSNLKDWRNFGATGPGVGLGLWMVRDNNEGNPGGPFYRSLINQGASTPRRGR